MLGIEVIVEPDTVPKGTFDPRKLDAPPGAVPPARRIEPDGRVFPLETDSEKTGALIASKPAPAPAPAPEPAPVAVAPAPAPEHEPLGARLRKKAALHADTAMPPRPAAASATSSDRFANQAPPTDDYQTAQIADGGLASAVGSLVKVTFVLAFLTLATVSTYLYFNDLLPWQQGSQVAMTPTPTQSPTPPRVEKHEVANPTTATPTTATTAVAAKPDVAHEATSSQAAVAMGAIPGGEKPTRVEDEPKVVEAPRITVTPDTGEDSDLDVRKVEGLRRDAVLLAQRGKLDEALAKLDALLAISPRDADALFRRALIFHKKRDYPTAARAYEAAIAVAAKGDAKAFNNLGLVREQQGDLKAAREVYERGLAHEPTDPNVLSNLGRLEKETDPQKALVRFEKALERDPRHPYARFHKASVLAIALPALGRAGEARKELEELAKPGSPVRELALDSLGTIAAREGKPADAIASFKKALEANPGLDDARLHLGIALFAAGKPAEARDELKTYLDKHPQSEDGWKTLGAALVKLDLLPEAKVAYEKALAINDKDATTLYNYALCAERYGNFLFAIQEYERVVALDPNHWRALTNLGRLYLRAGRTDKALEYFDKAIKLQPSEPGALAELHLHRANALAALGKDEEAKNALTEFLRLAPPTDPRCEAARKAVAFEGKLKPNQTEVKAISSPAPDRPKGF